jgi:hypothetical protein
MSAMGASFVAFVRMRDCSHQKQERCSEANERIDDIRRAGRATRHANSPEGAEPVHAGLNISDEPRGRKGRLLGLISEIWKRTYGRFLEAPPGGNGRHS